MKFSKQELDIDTYLQKIETLGDSLLIGTLYAGKKDKLFSDIDEATKKIEKVAYSINKNLPQMFPYE